MIIVWGFVVGGFCFVFLFYFCDNSQPNKHNAAAASERARKEKTEKKN